MPKNDKGKDFLFSKDCGFINGDDEGGESYRYSDGSGYYRGADGSEGYIYSDGSGYFHGADGSDGYIYSDGSAYFHGADGTDAYKYSDESGYYRGADGSDGYKYSDGSGHFTDSSGRRTSYDADDGDDDDEEGDASTDSSSWADLLVGAIGLAVGVGAQRRARRLEEERREEEEREAEAARIRRAKKATRRERKATRKIKKEKRRRKNALRRKRMWALIFKRKRIKIQHNSDELVGKSISVVYSALFENAFTNISVIPVKDIYVDSTHIAGEVERISVSGSSFFSEGDQIPYDAEIVITYHEKREFVIPFSRRELKKMGKTAAGDTLLGLGFTEIYTKPIRNLILGWLKKDGSIKKITVGGLPKFKKNGIFAYDTEIIIEYRTFKKKK